MIVEAGRIELPSKTEFHSGSTCLVWLLYLTPKLVSNSQLSVPARKVSSPRLGRPSEPARLIDAPSWYGRQISGGTAYGLSVSNVAVVGICVVSGKIMQVTRILHMLQNDSLTLSKPIAPIVKELPRTYRKRERYTRFQETFSPLSLFLSYT